MRVTKGRWDDNVRIYKVDPTGDWSEAIQVRMYKSLDTFEWERPEISSISFGRLTQVQARLVSSGFRTACRLAEEMFEEAKKGARTT
jgi:hypothetical protein